MSNNKKTLADHMHGMRGPGPRHFMGSDPLPKPKNRRGIIRWLWTYLAAYRTGLLGIVALVAISSGLALLGPYLIGRAIDKYISTGDMHGLARTAGLMILVYVIAALGTWAQSVGMVHISQRMVQKIRHDLFEHLQGLSLKFFDRNSHGDLMSRMSNDTDMISATLGNSVTQMINSALSIVGAGIIMFSLSWKLAAVSIITVPLVAIVTNLIATRTREGFRRRQQALGELNGIVEESIVGERVIKVCCRESETIDKFADANVNLKKTAIMAVIYIGTMGPFMNLFRNLGLALVAGTGGWMVAKGLTTLGVVAAIINYADYFNRPLNQLANIYGTIQQALAGADRVYAIMNESPEKDASDAVELNDVQGDVEFENVCFGYVENTPILKDISFHAPSGGTIALVGSTGAGKTTIINLLTRFYDIDSGSIHIDGKDIRNVSRSSLRKALGLVLQDTFLFTGTVRENIRYGRLDATDAEIEAAALLANADSFIKHLPKGYETLLTDAGSNLSQGQRQLLAIARALLADPAILILDEATSSVDTRTEIQIQQALQRLMQGRTSFIIAHRLNTIQRADCILVMEHGQIVECGNHEELIAQGGVYHGLYACQYDNGSRSESLKV